MQAFGYYLFAGFSRLLALIPFRMALLWADLIYLVLYHLMGYRKAVVHKNLRNAFPDYSEEQIQRTAKKFYRHLADLFIENMVFRYLPAKKFMTHCHYTNPELVERYYQQGKSAIVIIGHYGNWELATLYPLITQYSYYPVYKPLSNAHFDKFYKQYRSRFGGHPLPMKATYRQMIQNKKQGIRSVLGLVADQRPIKSESFTYMTFLNQRSRVFMGPEKMAKKLDMLVFFARVKKVARGRYQVVFELVTDTPQQEPDYAITQKHLAILEQMIREEPAHWLWSHRRWRAADDAVAARPSNEKTN